MEENFNHVPVLLNECIEGLNIKPDGVYVDCTLGGGGHSGEIAKRLTTGRLISIDKDEDAIAYSKPIKTKSRSYTMILRTLKAY